jgi:hypothetical protein
MAKKELSKDQRPGFRLGDYFVTFPDDEFIKEDEESGRLYILADIYKIDNDKTTAYKLKESEITPAVEKMISDEVNRLLTEGAKFDDSLKKEV